MPKVGMEPIRRQQLIDATLSTMQQYGLADTTVSRISKEAGVSAGIIAHYFGDKNGLLVATMKDLLRTLQQKVTVLEQGSSSDISAKQKLVNIINANFSAEQVNQQAIVVWLNFWAQAMHHPELARLQRVNRLRLQSNLCFWLREFLPKSEARLKAAGLAALIDGLWLRGAFESGGIDVDKSRLIAMDYLESILPSNTEI